MTTRRHGPGYSVTHADDGTWTACAWDGRGKAEIVYLCSTSEQAMREVRAIQARLALAAQGAA
jgi:hypothetical protein